MNKGYPKGLLNNLQYDIPAGLVVFLVALPLCLGIALASFPAGYPLFPGILAGIAGGIIVPFISKSSLSVSGPAAGLTAIVLDGVIKAGSLDAFLAAVVLAGIFQVVLGFLKAGTIAYFFPSAVIRGMLTGIGLILIIKQLPHALGVDKENFGVAYFLSPGSEDAATLYSNLFTSWEWGALLITIVSIGIILLWENTTLKKLSLLPSALVVVIVGTLMNLAYKEHCS